MQDHHAIRRLIEAEQEAAGLLAAVTTVIDEASGIDFARLAARSGC